jgi:hypothetical protein
VRGEGGGRLGVHDLPWNIRKYRCSQKSQTEVQGASAFWSEAMMEKTELVTGRARKREARDDARYRDVLEGTVRVIRRIPDFEDACAVLATCYPNLFHELVHVGLERLNAGAGVVRVERFQEICDEYVDRWIEVIGLTISPQLKLARGAALSEQSAADTGAH